MTDERLSLEKAFRTGWAILTARPDLWLGYFGILLGLGLVEFALGRLIDSNAVRIVLSLVFKLVQWYLTFGAIGLTLKLVRGQPAQLKELFEPRGTYWSYVAATILYFLICLFGFIAFIVPGIILGLMFMFYGYAIADKNVDPIAGLAASARLTKGHKWDLFVFGLIGIALNVVGALCLLVGLLVTLAITHFALAELYRQLNDQPPAQP